MSIPQGLVDANDWIFGEEVDRPVSGAVTLVWLVLLILVLAAWLVRRTNRLVRGDRRGDADDRGRRGLEVVRRGGGGQRRLAGRRARRDGAPRAERSREDHALRTIGGLTLPSEGAVTVFGEPVRRNPALYRRIGYMPEHEAVYDFTGRQFVEPSAPVSRGWTTSTAQ